MNSDAPDDVASASAPSPGKRVTHADHQRLRRHLLDVGAERAAATASARLALGCCAKIGPSMPSWAPRRGARCGAAPTYFPGFTIGGKLVVLPLCVVHHTKLERNSDPEGLAADWAP
jgi:hypothetical protein